VHGTPHRVVKDAWEQEKPSLQPLVNRRAYPLGVECVRLGVECVRRVTRDAFVCWQSNRYSVPWQNAGKQVRVREVGAVIEILREATQGALHSRGRLRRGRSIPAVSDATRRSGSRLTMPTSRCLALKSAKRACR